MRILALVFLLAFAAAATAEAKAKHVVLVVWDGMRADFVTEDYTPNLWKLAQEGTAFRKQHSMYPTLTNVNGTVFATGVFPNRSGVIANNEFRPELDPKGPVDTAVVTTIRKADELSGGKYLAVPTIPEMLQAAGRRSAIAGTKWVANLFDRARSRGEAGKNSPTVVAGEAFPAEVARALQDSLGKFPERRQFPNLAQDQWTTAALIQTLWQDGLPDFSLLWLSDPDFTSHETAPGSPAVLAGVKNCDAMLGRVLDVLEAKHLRAETDVFVTSDHGFSTVERAVEMPKALADAGFEIPRGGEEAKPGTVRFVGNGGTSFFYVKEGDAAVIRRLVDWLEQSDFAGVIFTREKIEGTFSLADAHLETKGGPDVVMAFRWSETSNRYGAPGSIVADSGRAAGKGTHATLSKFDLHNILFAAGPDFRRGFQDESPSGNIDVAPTIAHILGLNPPTHFDGRILSEAMTSETSALSPAQTETREASRVFPNGEWKQSLKISRLGDEIYFDQGNGSFRETAR